MEFVVTVKNGRFVVSTQDGHEVAVFQTMKEAKAAVAWAKANGHK